LQAKDERRQINLWGEYKIPGEKELKILRRAVSERNKDPEANPHAELDEQALRHAKGVGFRSDGRSESQVASGKRARCGRMK
jgi:hypothetical protein